MKPSITGNLLTFGRERVLLSHVTSYFQSGSRLILQAGRNSVEIQFSEGIFGLPEDEAACVAFLAELDGYFAK